MRASLRGAMRGKATEEAGSEKTLPENGISVGAVKMRSPPQA